MLPAEGAESCLCRTKHKCGKVGTAVFLKSVVHREHEAYHHKYTPARALRTLAALQAVKELAFMGSSVADASS